MANLHQKTFIIDLSDKPKDYKAIISGIVVAVNPRENLLSFFRSIFCNIVDDTTDTIECIKFSPQCINFEIVDLIVKAESRNANDCDG